MAHVQSKSSRLAASFLHISWAVGKMPTLLEGDTRQQAGLATQWRASALKERWRPAAMAHAQSKGRRLAPFEVFAPLRSSLFLQSV